MKRAALILPLIIAGCQTTTGTQSLYGVIGGYEAALAAADSYLCRSGPREGECDPRPVCVRARQLDCVNGDLAEALRTAEAATDPAYQEVKAAVAGGSLAPAEAASLQPQAAALQAATRQITARIAAAAAKAKG